MVTKLEVPNSIHINYRNKWVRLDEETTEKVLLLLDLNHTEWSDGRMRRDMSWAYEKVGPELVDVLNHLEFEWGH